MKREPQKEDQKHKRKWFILLLLLILFLLGMLLCMCFHNKASNGQGSSETSVAQGGIDLTIDPNAEEDNSHAAVEENIEEQSVVISGKGAITVSSGEREAYVDFYNHEQNEGLYYLTFELRLYDSDGQDYEILYTSGLVEPGMRIQKITLSRTLKTGVYKAVVHVQPYRMNENLTPTNNADMEIMLIVK